MFGKWSIAEQRRSPAIAETADRTALDIMIGEKYYNIFVRRSQFQAYIRPLFATSAEYKKEDKKHTQYEASESK